MSRCRRQEDAGPLSAGMIVTLRGEDSRLSDGRSSASICVCACVLYWTDRLTRRYLPGRLRIASGFRAPPILDFGMAVVRHADLSCRPVVQAGPACKRLAFHGARRAGPERLERGLEGHTHASIHRTFLFAVRSWTPRSSTTSIENSTQLLGDDPGGQEMLSPTRTKEDWARGWSQAWSVGWPSLLITFASRAASPRHHHHHHLASPRPSP